MDLVGSILPKFGLLGGTSNLTLPACGDGTGGIALAGCWAGATCVLGTAVAGDVGTATGAIEA